MTATFTVKLTSQPTANVTIGLSSTNTAEGTVSPASLTFTSANWNTAQTVTVTGVDDLVDDGDIAYTIVTTPASSSDGQFDGLDPANVAATNNDYETNLTPTNILLTNSTVLENITGKTIGNLAAVDADAADTHTFFVVDSRFVISGNLLSLAPGTSLDQSMESSVSLEVTTRDSGTPPRELTKLLEIIVLANPFPWQNKPNALDSRNDGNVIPLDVLAIINELNGRTISDAAGRLPRTRPANSSLPYFDVSGDSFVTPIDALQIVNALNHLQGGEGEANESKAVVNPPSWVLPPTGPSAGNQAAHDSSIATSAMSPTKNENQEYLFAVIGGQARRAMHVDSSLWARAQTRSKLESILDEIALDVYSAMPRKHWHRR